MSRSWTRDAVFNWLWRLFSPRSRRCEHWPPFGNLFLGLWWVEGHGRRQRGRRIWWLNWTNEKPRTFSLIESSFKRHGKESVLNRRSVYYVVTVVRKRTRDPRSGGMRRCFVTPHHVWWNRPSSIHVFRERRGISWRAAIEQTGRDIGRV